MPIKTYHVERVTSSIDREIVKVVAEFPVRRTREDADRLRDAFRYVQTGCMSNFNTLYRIRETMGADIIDADTPILYSAEFRVVDWTGGI